MSTATINSPLMDAVEVGRILGEDRQTVLAMARRGEIASIKRNARSVKFTQQHVDDYIAAHETPVTTAPKTVKPTRNPKYTR